MHCIYNIIIYKEWACFAHSLTLPPPLPPRSLTVTDVILNKAHQNHCFCVLVCNISTWQWLYVFPSTCISTNSIVICLTVMEYYKVAYVQYMYPSTCYKVARWFSRLEWSGQFCIMYCMYMIKPTILHTKPFLSYTIVLQQTQWSIAVQRSAYSLFIKICGKVNKHNGW